MARNGWHSALLVALFGLLAASSIEAQRGVDSVFDSYFESGDACDWSLVVTPDPADGQNNDCDLLTDEDGDCIGGDGFCPGGGFVCNSNNDTDCPSVCGNSVVESGETCDGPESCKSCPAEPFACFGATGDAETCDLLCHQAVTTCGIDGDGCCAFDGEGGCSSADDDECTGTEWEYLRWAFDANYGAGCQTVRVYGITAGAHYLFTTCAPDGAGPGTGDPVITLVVDSNGQSYPVGNDDCSEASALPNLAGWSCVNAQALLRMSCSPPAPGGFAVIGSPVWIEVTICPHGGTAFGVSPFHIWWNGGGSPNPG